MLEVREGLSQGIVGKVIGKKIIKQGSEAFENSWVKAGHSVCQQISMSLLKKYLLSIQHGEP